MPDIFPLVSRFFWLIALVVTAINALLFHQRLRPLIAQDPRRERGYHQFLLGLLLVSGLLWSLMGIGILVGGVPDVFAYFQPQAGNPFVIAWHGTLIALWIIGSVWIFGRGGAEFFVSHPGLLRGPVTSPTMVRLWFGLAILGGIVAEICMWMLPA